MIISVINQTHGTLGDAEIQRVLRAVNRQIAGAFAPYWSLSAELRLEGRSSTRPSKESLPDMRGDAVLYLWDEIDIDDALGYHDINHRGIPFGFAFTELAKALEEPWSVTFSHEALELVGDPEVNLLVAGPHPKDRSRDVFHWYEMCDAVQAETYEIDEVAVSNFVLPLYFTDGDEIGSRNDFLGSIHDGKTLRSFSTNPGGYVGFFDPRTGKMLTHDHDEKAKRRRELKSRTKGARRGIRYGRFRTAGEPVGRKARKRR